MDSPFDNSPNEILVEIFQYLDVLSVKSAALVCKRWSDVIGFSSKLMQKCVLTIVNRDNRDLSAVLTFRRIFSNVKVDPSSEIERNYAPIRDPAYNAQLVRALEHVGTNVTHFTLKQFKLDRNELTSMFGSMPELTTITLSEVDIIESRKKRQKSTLLLEKLKFLEASYTTWLLTDILRAPNLTHLQISGLRNRFHATSFRSFIETAASLRTFIIWPRYGYPRRRGFSASFNCENSLVFYETLGSIDSMHLPRLDNLEIRGLTSQSLDTFCRFLSARSNTLAKLTLTMNWDTTDRPGEAFERLFHIVFGELKRLNELTLRSPKELLEGPNDRRFFDKLKNSIDSLQLTVFYGFSKGALERVLSICRGLTSLEIDELTQDGARFIANNLKLAKLTVQNVVCRNVHFPTVNVIGMQYDENNHWQNFLKINGHVETVIFSETSVSRAHFLIDYIINKTNVKHLTVKTVAPINAYSYEKIAENPKGLQTLEWISVDRSSETAISSSLLLKLPLNRDLKYLRPSEPKKQRTTL